MAEMTEFQAIPIKDLLGDLQKYRYNPTLIQRRILDHLEDITSGKIDIVDPSNPFIFLLEASCVNTAFNIQENEISLRKQYPILSQSIEDLYLHMSDQDYVDRFATPSSANFTFYFEVNSLLNNMVDVPSEEYHKITIARNTEVTVDGVTFSLQYPINIYKHYTGNVKVEYDTTIESPYQSLTTNVIDYIVRVDSEQTKWLTFSIPLHQFKIINTEIPVQLSRPFVEKIAFDDEFYTARVFYKGNSSSDWQEIKTTHTEQVYDPYVPTAVLKVLNKEVQVFIPPVYTVNKLITGTVRIDVYSTRGKIDMNFSNYEIKDFSTTLKAIDEIRDIGTFTNAMDQVTFFSTTADTVVSGTNAITLKALREAVVQNSIGDRTLPITPTQIEYTVERKGFEVYKNIDVITNRIFTASQSIPRSRNRYPVTPMAFTVMSYIDTMEYLSNRSFVYNNGERLTIPSYTTFEVRNNQLLILDRHERTRLNSLSRLDFLEEVNTRRLLTNPFHYVLDHSNNEFDLRAYSLDYPKADWLSFVSQNATLQLSINTGQYSLEKKDFGYRLTLVTKSGDFYKQLDDENVGIQIAFIPPGEKTYGYLTGELVGKTEANERIFQFDLQTNYDIDDQDQLYLTNFQIPTNPTVTLPVSLDHNFLIFHYTNSITPTYKQSESDRLLGRFQLSPDHAVVTHEELYLKFGSALSNMWRHYRSAASGYDYATYEADVPMVYEDDIYKVNPKTGLIFDISDDCIINFNLQHKKGEIVRNLQNEIIYKYRKGDAKLDKNGNPILLSDLRTLHFMDLVLMDYKHYVANREDHVTYLKDVIAAIDKWVTSDLEGIDDILLEQTRIFFKPKKAIGNVLVLIKDGVKDHIDTLQSFNVKFYVNNATYNDTRIRQNIEYRTIEILSEELAKTRVSKSEMIIRLKNEFTDTIDTVALSGLGGNLDLDVVILEEQGSILALNKKLVQQEDGQLIVQEDVHIEFIDIEQD